MKKVYVLLLIVALSSLALASGVMSFVPKNANFVVDFTNNSQNYDALKKVNAFSFLLNDLGIENLIQSSVSQTAVSIGVKSSQVWKLTENDFVIFGDAKAQELREIQNEKLTPNIEIVLQGKEKIFLDLLSALVGGEISSKNVEGYDMKIFQTSKIELYVTQHDDYVLVSNSPKLISTSIKTYEGNATSFAFSQSIPSNAWFKFYMQGDSLTDNSTSAMIPTNGYGYGKVENGELIVNGTSNFEYKDAKLRAKLISFKPDARSLQEMPATGDVWAGVDIADPVGFYDLVKEHAKDFKLEKGAVSKEEGRKLTEHLNGKAFLDASVASENSNFAATIYLSKDLSEYIPDFSKDASATFTWKGHTVLRDDTVDGTTTTHTYTIFYPDKVIITDLEPQSAENFFNAPSSAKEMGNYSSFANLVWDKAFLIGYMDVGKLVETLLQYPLTSGAFLQMKFNENASLIWQLIIK